MKNKYKGLRDELLYCQQMIAKKHPSHHWALRIKEIELELKQLKPKRKKKNGRS